ncbi:MAG: hypothetical protein U1E50_08990 [Caulobacteraceae bacterium]
MSDIDSEAAHAAFSKAAYNAAADILWSDDRSPEAVQRLLTLAHASYWHWTQREDATARNLSIAHWMLSRAHEAAGDGQGALTQARLCMATARETAEPYFIGAAYEVTARALIAVRRLPEARDAEAEARAIAGTLDAEEAKMLLDELDTLPF